MSEVYEHLDFTEMATYPVGYILYFNPPPNLSNGLTEITEFSQHEYDDECAYEMIIPCKERLNDYIGDFRSRDNMHFNDKLKEE